MRDRLIDGLIQGDRLAWGAIGALWALTAVVVLIHRPSHGPSLPSNHGRAAWTWLLFAVATGTSMAGLPLSAAIAMPRVRWATVDAPELVASGGESWRRLRGPPVVVTGPDIAVPTIDATDRWVLVGVLSGNPVEGLPAALPAPMKPGAPRLCPPSGEACRPWPVAWPDPARPMALGELTWSHAGGVGEPVRVADALAYDVETGLYLRHVEPAPGTAPGSPQLELVGRLTGDAPREGGALLAVVRKAVAGRLKGARILGAPSPSGSGHVFVLQRAEVSLTAGPRVFAWGVRPVLILTSFALPLGVLALLLAPLLHRSRWLRTAEGELPSGHTRREASAWIAPYLEAAAVLAAGISAAAPAVVAIASLWGSR